ncbi:MAG: pyrimidine dimer DNA glycosylase/endonuclease V [Bacteroidales bacterium]
MRIWSLHPKYLDAKGLVALWRETLLARNVLENKTKGYRYHPQLKRFKESDYPLDAINYYLTVIYDEAVSRNYNFNQNKIGRSITNSKIPVTKGQVQYEFDHLLGKLKTRDHERYSLFSKIEEPDLHSLFFKVEGTPESWERIIENKD